MELIGRPLLIWLDLHEVIMNWFYRLYKLRMIYYMDEAAKIATITINKPHTRLQGTDAEQVQALMEHFSGRGYHVIIKD